MKTCYVCKLSFHETEICKNKKCKSCMKLYKKEWYEKNKERISSVVESYRSANRPALRAADKLWRKNNPERDKARVRKWALLNKDKRSESAARRKALKLGSQVTPITRENLLGRLSVFGGDCSYCGGKFEHWDHVKPLSNGGAHIISNLRPSCSDCNLRKGSMSPFEWFRLISRPKAL